MPKKGYLPKSPWGICKGCGNNRKPDVQIGSFKSRGFDLGDVCLLSYAGENESLRALVKSGYRECSGFKRKEEV